MSSPRHPELGLVEWLRPGEYERTEASVARLQALGIRHLRTHLSWAEYHGPGGQAWYDWLLPRLARDLEILPCIHYTPPSLSETGRTSGPPRRPRALADFVDCVISRYAGCFSTIELWNEPNNLLDWDWRQDPDWMKFCEMAGAAAYWARQRGLRVILGGPSPVDPVWLGLMGRRGVLGVVDGVGLHGFPGTWDSEEATWPGWHALVGEVREVVREHNPDLAIWITEAGYSTWRHDEFRQARHLLDALQAPVERLYWYGLQDIDPAVAVQEGLRFDQRHYHFGLYDAEGCEKLLGRLLRKAGVQQVEHTAGLAARAPAIVGRRRVVITGGAGFIGCNLANRLAGEGEDVLLLDGLARDGVERNLAWLQKRHPKRISAVIADVRDPDAVAEAVGEAKAVFHLAAQVAVTTSLRRPGEDFDINLRGTLNMLEAARRRPEPPPFLFASTNKVYGDLGDVPLRLGPDGYAPTDPALRANGVNEDRPLDFHTPYGCSKGAADQYVLDYARSFGLPAVALRMSCIYGPHQMGTEDQGWVAHFLLRALADEPITVYGDGHQVRDVLHVDDAVDAYLAAWRQIGAVAGRAFNLGGGPGNAVSLRQVIAFVAELLGHPIAIEHAGWRTGDQRYYVSDVARVRRALRLRPPTHWRTGIADLARWLAAEHGLRAPSGAPGAAPATAQVLS